MFALDFLQVCSRGAGTTCVELFQVFADRDSYDEVVREAEVKE